MRHLAAIILALAASASLAQEVPSAASLQWAHVSSAYHHFDEIKPKLINNGKSSVFLSRLWPNGSAQLERFNEESSEWERGEWSITCGSVAHPTVPIEIKPNAEEDIQVYWQLSTDEWTKPKHFVVIESRQKRVIRGRYRFVLRYSLQPWTLVQHPSAVYSITSPEFLVTG